MDHATAPSSLQHPPGYPLPETTLRPAWTDPRSRALAGFAVAMALVATATRLPIRISGLDDLVLLVLFPATMSFVLAFAPRPGTRVGRIAKDITVVGLAFAPFAGELLPVAIACYPLVLVAAVFIGRNALLPRVWSLGP